MGRQVQSPRKIQNVGASIWSSLNMPKLASTNSLAEESAAEDTTIAAGGLQTLFLAFISVLPLVPSIENLISLQIF